jgi:hypothetical protein
MINHYSNTELWDQWRKIDDLIQCKVYLEYPIKMPNTIGCGFDDRTIECLTPGPQVQPNTSHTISMKRV